MRLDPRWNLLSHPYYRAWECGALSKDSIREYASQYYHHVRAFPRYVSATHSQLEAVEDRQILLDNLIDEEKGPENHPELWLRFAAGLGADRAAIKSAAPGPAVRELVDCFLRLTRASAAQGLGALFAYESQVPEIARFKMDALQKFYVDAEDSEAVKFFAVHKEADVYHTQALLELLEKLPADERREAEGACSEAAQALWKFLDGMQAQASAA